MAWSFDKILKIRVAECPECLCKIPFYKTAELGQIVYCPECLERLAVHLVDPPQLSRADYEIFEEYDAWTCGPEVG